MGLFFCFQMSTHSFENRYTRRTAERIQETRRSNGRRRHPQRIDQSAGRKVFKRRNLILDARRERQPDS
jgi:hypothetical protein